MSAKKKNPLKDLSAFLAHQEEASKVPTPKKLSDATEEFMGKKPTQITNVGRPAKITIAEDANPVLIKELLNEIAKKDSDNFRGSLYDIILTAIEKLPNNTPEDKMLINTVLYISNQENWKEVIKTYWMNHSNG